jgi:hypothetical protein
MKVKLTHIQADRQNAYHREDISSELCQHFHAEPGIGKHECRPPFVLLDCLPHTRCLRCRACLGVLRSLLPTPPHLVLAAVPGGPSPSGFCLHFLARHHMCAVLAFEGSYTKPLSSIIPSQPGIAPRQEPKISSV